MHLVGFTIRIHHDARSPECQRRANHLGVTFGRLQNLIYFYTLLVHTESTAQIIQIIQNGQIARNHVQIPKSNRKGHQAHPSPFMSRATNFARQAHNPSLNRPKTYINFVNYAYCITQLTLIYS